MAKKKTPASDGEAPVAIPLEDTTAVLPLAEAVPTPVETDGQPAPVPAEAPSEPTTTPPTNGVRAPLVSWRLSSDRSTSIELAVWSNTYRNGQGEESEQLSMTLQRSYKDQNQQWCKGGSWRIHDLPVLVFLLNKAHGYALNRRTSDNSLPF